MISVLIILVVQVDPLSKAEQRQPGAEPAERDDAGGGVHQAL